MSEMSVEEEIFKAQDENKQALILDIDSALRISIVVQNGAIGIKWKDDALSEVFSEKLFASRKEAELFISSLLENHIGD